MVKWDQCWGRRGDLRGLLQSLLRVEGKEGTACDQRRYSSPIVEGRRRVLYGKGRAEGTEKVWGLGRRCERTYRSEEGIDEGAYALGDHLNTGGCLEARIGTFCGARSELFLYFGSAHSHGSTDLDLAWRSHYGGGSFSIRAESRNFIRRQLSNTVIECSPCPFPWITSGFPSPETVEIIVRGR